MRNIMTHRVTITLDEETFAFLNDVANSNRSAYINQLLKQEHKNFLREALRKANQEEAEDTYQEELQEWDSTLSSGSWIFIGLTSSPL